MKHRAVRFPRHLSLLILCTFGISYIPLASANWLDGCTSRSDYLSRMKDGKCSYLGTMLKRDGVAAKKFPDGSTIYMWTCAGGGLDVGRYWTQAITTGEWCELRYMATAN